MNIEALTWDADGSEWTIHLDRYFVETEQDKDYGDQVETGRTLDSSRKLGTYVSSRGDDTLFLDGKGYQCLIESETVEMSTGLPNSKPWSASGNQDKIARSHQVNLSLGTRMVRIDSESRKKFIVSELPQGQEPVKVGQFDGSSRLKHFSLELEGAALDFSDLEKTFISIVARQCLESRLLTSTLIWTSILMLTIPLIILYFLGIL